MTTVVSAIFRIRRDTAANWTSANPVLKLGEPGLETDTRRVKYGDGSTAWNSLGYSVADARSGTSFPGSPATGTRFYRTDRNIEYFYDGTRWLSTQIYSLTSATPNTMAPTVTVTTSNDMGNPWGGLYDIWIEQLVFTSRLTGGTSSTDYFAAKIYDHTANVDVGTSSSAQGDTANVYTAHRHNIGASFPKTSHNIRVVYTASGSPTAILNASVLYRLIG